MSTVVFPTFNLNAKGYPSGRAPIWRTDIEESISGMECRIAYYTFPKYKWNIDLNVLRSVLSANDFATFLGFYNARQGQFDTWLYQDDDDYTVTGQAIATGDGSTKNFQLVRTYGGFAEPVLAPNTGGTINIYLNGVKQMSGYTVSGWGTTTPGILAFTSAPGNTVAITADFTYYFPCRFVSDTQQFTLLMNKTYQAKSISFQSVKN